MNRRGHALLLVLAVLATLGAAGTVFFTRLSVDVNERRAERVRTQAFWLARSAITAGISGTRAVETPEGPARVRVRRQGDAVSAEVQLEGAEATLSTEPAGWSYAPASVAP